MLSFEINPSEFYRTVDRDLSYGYLRSHEQQKSFFPISVSDSLTSQTNMAANERQATPQSAKDYGSCASREVGKRTDLILKEVS